MRILYTNNTLSQPAGTELAVRDLCLEMRRRGHEVAAFSIQHGRIAESLREAGVAVAARPDEVPFRPEVIHGHHEWETSLAALQWPDCPVISFCRGVDGWQEEPCLAPNVVRWVAVDEPCRERLLKTPGVVGEKVRLVLNGIDLERFRAGTEGGQRQARALILSNYATEDNYAAVVVEGCRMAALDCQVMGAGVGRSVADPERLLSEFSVVFAKGKVALEAMACGCAVIVCDQRGLGPLVTPENFDQLRRESFGFPCMIDAVTTEGIVSRLAQRNLEEVAWVCAKTREVAGAGRMFDELEHLYAEVAGETVNASAQEVAVFASRFLSDKGKFYKLGKEVWNHGVTLDLIPAADKSGHTAEIGINRMLDRLKKGIVALKELKETRKCNLSEKGDVPRPGFWQKLWR